MQGKFSGTPDSTDATQETFKCAQSSCPKPRYTIFLSVPFFGNATEIRSAPRTVRSSFFSLTTWYVTISANLSLNPSILQSQRILDYFSYCFCFEVRQNIVVRPAQYEFTVNCVICYKICQFNP